MTKQSILSILAITAALATATKRGQAQEVTPMIIHATTVVTPPDNGGDDPNPPTETATVIYAKGNHIKTESKSDRSHNITIIDKDALKTTSLTEANGRRSGYYSIDTPHTAPVRLDSNGNVRKPASTSIQYIDSSKTIAGFACKKAVATTKFGGRSMDIVIWYTLDLPLKSPIPQGAGRFGFAGVSDLKGFPMAYSLSLPNGLTIQYQVSKVDLNASVKDSDFDIPKGYDVKPESERPRNNGFGGGFGGGPGGGGPPPGGGGPGGI